MNELMNIGTYEKLKKY